MCFIVLVESRRGVIYGMDNGNNPVEYGYYTGKVVDDQINNGARICDVKRPLVVMNYGGAYKDRIKHYKSLRSAKTAVDKYVEKLKEPAPGAGIFRRETVNVYQISVINMDTKMTDYCVKSMI